MNKFEEWKNSIKKSKRMKTYKHLDNPLNLDKEKSFKKIISILLNLKEHQFLPFIRRDKLFYRYTKKKGSKPEKNRKNRQIMYASHIDAAIYSYYNYIFYNHYELELGKRSLFNNVSAYRRVKIEGTEKGKSNINFADDVYQYIKKQDSCAVITQDIKGFFDKIDHNILKEKLCLVSNVDNLDPSFYKTFKSITKYRYIKYNDFNNKKIQNKIRNKKDYIFNILKDIIINNKNGYGIPQGSPLSGLFSNIYLIDFDTQITSKKPQVFYRRYSDDLIFVCRKEEVSELMNIIDVEIKKHKLEIQRKKCFISYLDKVNGKIKCSKVTDGDGNLLNNKYFDYLGFEFYGDEILVRKKTIGKLGYKQKEKIKKHSTNTSFSGVANKNKKSKRKSPNYLENIKNIFPSRRIQIQLTNISKRRNKLKLELNKNSKK